jgi:hypothetical protein
MIHSDKYLDKFVKDQRVIMSDYDKTHGCEWINLPDHILVDNLFEEIREFEIKDDPDRELLDIANSCYILWAKRRLRNGR